MKHIALAWLPRYHTRRRNCSALVSALQMSHFAEITMLCSVTFFVGVAVGLLAAAWSDMFSDKSTKNPTDRPRIVQHGAGQLRDHADLDTISKSTRTGEPNPAEFEKWQRNLRRAGKSRE